MRPVSPAAFLFDAKGVCFLATATRLFGANDTVRLYSLGRLATWRDHFGFIGGNMGLCAGRKRGRTENNGKPLHDAPKSRARAKRRANANEASFDIDVRSSGTAAGKHFVPRLPNPTRKGRNPIGAEQVKRELLRHHSRDFMSVLSLSHIWSVDDSFRRRACEPRSMVTTEVRGHWLAVPA